MLDIELTPLTPSHPHTLTPSQELGEREREAGVEEERRREVERELEKTRRQLKTEREKWTEEKDTIEQVSNPINRGL